MNRKRVIRLMQADNLLCLRKRRYVCTTDSLIHPARAGRFRRILTSGGRT